MDEPLCNPASTICAQLAWHNSSPIRTQPLHIKPLEHPDMPLLTRRADNDNSLSNVRKWRRERLQGPDYSGGHLIGK